jgi:hypothetical protein
MATLIWNGGESATTKTFMTAANWGGTAPSNDDTLIINTSSDTIGGAATGLTGITFRVGEGFTGTIGSSTTYLDLDGALCEFASGGVEAYLTGTWTNFRITGGSASDSFLRLKGNASTAITTLLASRLNGTATVDSSAAVTTVLMNGNSTGTIALASSISGLANITASEGTVECASSISGTVNVLGGTVQTSGTAAFPTITIDTGGSVDYRSSGTVTTLNIYDGVFSSRDNETAGFTITNVNNYSGGRLLLDSALNNSTVTNAIQMLGGDASFPVGSTISLG